MRDLILGLARPLLRLLGRDDRGAVAVLIGVLVGMGVLLGMGAMAIDVGQLYQERAELQNGAGAAALAVAESCNSGTCNTGLAPAYANRNASSLTNHFEKVDLICSSDPSLGPLLPNVTVTNSGCPSSNQTYITNCPPNPVNLPPDANYVDVHTSTKIAKKVFLLPPVFARTLLGNSSYKGTNVKACAQAEWGPLGSGGGFAMAISKCAWQNLSGDTDLFTDPYDQNNPGVADGDGDKDQSAYYKLLPLYLMSSSKACATSASGSNVSGGFGWLNTDYDQNSDVKNEPNADNDNDGDGTSSCTPYIASGATYTGDSSPGVNISPACQTVLYNDIKYNDGQVLDGNVIPNGKPGAGFPENPKIAWLPVFSNTPTTNGNNATYSIVGLAGFVFMGYSKMNFSPNNYSPADMNTLCTANKCIEGYFAPGFDPLGKISKNPNPFGATAVQLTG